jgi:anti-anti-sigma regulatory factor
MHTASADDVEVVFVSGETDLESRLGERLARALESGRPILVDLSDCTFLDVTALQAVEAAYRETCRLGLGFVVVVPYRVTHIVGRLILELLPELARYSVVPTRERALRALAVRRPHERVGSDQLDAIRAHTWSIARRPEELIAERGEIVLELRDALSHHRRARAASRAARQSAD